MSEFLCGKCKYLFEKNDVPPFKEDGMPNYSTECPKCGGEAHIQIELSDVIKTHPSNSIDMVVGKESEKRWGANEERKNKRAKVRKETGQTALALDLQQKTAVSKINYEYKSVSKERIQERKALYNEYERSQKDSNKK